MTTRNPITPSSMPPSPSAHGPLRELAGLFLKLGVTAFGGPAAHIAMMEDEVVRRRGWLSREQFLDLLGATNLIPGPNSTELAIHIGHQRGGWRGLLVAGSCFILPAAGITLAIAWAYVRFGSMPAAAGLLYGVKPVIIAVVVQALWRLAGSAVKNRVLGILAGAGVAAGLLGAPELGILFGTGALCTGLERLNRGRPASSSLGIALLLSPGSSSGELGGAHTRLGGAHTGLSGADPALVGAATGSAVAGGAVAGVYAFSQAKLLLFFLKVGSVLFGSGYVLLAFLRADLVDRWHWLSEAQLLDAVAVGQFTPGPVFTTATFIGYLLGGTPGAAAATVGIFLPAFVFVALSGPLIPRLRRSASAGAFLDGVNVASLALMATVTWQLARAAVIDIPTLTLAVVSAVLLLRFKLSSTWLVAGGALVGAVLSGLR